MASTAPKVPIPLPVGGVHRHRNPRMIGPNALVDSQNWILRNGTMQVRPGLDFAEFSSPSLMPSEEAAYLNESDLGPAGSIVASLYFPDGPAATPASVSELWYGVEAADGELLSDPTIVSYEAHLPGDPAFLDHDGDGYLKIVGNFGDAPASITIQHAPYLPDVGVQIRIYRDNTTNVVSFTAPNPGLGDSSFELSNGATVHVAYHAHLGAPVFVDVANQRLIHKFSSYGDVTVAASDGTEIAIYYSSGYAPDLFFDDDGAVATERLYYYSQTSANITIEYGSQASMSICSPLVPIGSGVVRAQLKIAGSNSNSSVRVKLIGFNYAEPETYLGTWLRDDYNSVTQPEYWWSGESVLVEDLTWTQPSATWVEFNNIYEAEYLALVVEFIPADVTDYFAIGEVMITSGSLSPAFSAPGTTGSPINQIPLAVYSFEEDEDTTFVVVATDAGLWKMNSDYSWTSIGTWTKTSDGEPEAVTLSGAAYPPVFKTFAGSVNGGDQARYMVVVAPEADAMYWSGSGSAQRIVKANPDPEADDVCMTCRSVVSIFRRLIYCGLYDDPYAVQFTDQFDIDVWEDPNGKVRLVDTQGSIVGALEIGNTQAVIYKDDAIYMAVAQGMAQPFRFELKAANIDGPVSARAIVALGDGRHAYLSHTADVVIFDGVRPVSLGEHIQLYLQDVIDFERIGSSYIIYDPRIRELSVYYPPYNSGDLNGCAVINLGGEFPTLWPQRYPQPISAGGHIVIDLAKTIDELGEVPIDALQGRIDDYGSLRPESLLLDDVGRPMLNGGSTDFGSPIEHYLETGAYDMGEFSSYKTVQEIDHLFDSGARSPLISDPGQREALFVDLLSSIGGIESDSTGAKALNIRAGYRNITRHRVTSRMFSLRIFGDSSSSLKWFGSEASVVRRGYR
jgi:hypothetical protein